MILVFENGVGGWFRKPSIVVVQPISQINFLEVPICPFPWFQEEFTRALSETAKVSSSCTSEVIDNSHKLLALLQNLEHYYWYLAMAEFTNRSEIPTTPCWTLQVLYSDLELGGVRLWGWWVTWGGIWRCTNKPWIRSWIGSIYMIYDKCNRG